MKLSKQLKGKVRKLKLVWKAVRSGAFSIEKLSERLVRLKNAPMVSSELGNLLSILKRNDVVVEEKTNRFVVKKIDERPTFKQAKQILVKDMKDVEPLFASTPRGRKKRKEKKVSGKQATISDFLQYSIPPKRKKQKLKKKHGHKKKKLFHKRK